MHIAAIDLHAQVQAYFDRLSVMVRKSCKEHMAVEVCWGICQSDTSMAARALKCAQVHALDRKLQYV